MLILKANGPAIWGGCVTRRSIRAGSWYFSHEAVTVQGGYGALFAVRVQVLLVIRVSLYKYDRSREFIPGNKFGGGLWRGRGISHYKFVLGAGAKAKSVTNNLPILSVLAADLF
jgi:hypothetical protein